MKTDSGVQQPDILDSSKQTKFNDFLEHIKEEQKNIDMRLFRPDRMTNVLYNSKSNANNQNKVGLIYG